MSNFQPYSIKRYLISVLCIFLFCMFVAWWCGEPVFDRNPDNISWIIVASILSAVMPFALDWVVIPDRRKKK